MKHHSLSGKMLRSCIAVRQAAWQSRTRMSDLHREDLNVCVLLQGLSSWAAISPKGCVWRLHSHAEA